MGGGRYKLASNSKRSKDLGFHVELTLAAKIAFSVGAGQDKQTNQSSFECIEKSIHFVEACILMGDIRGNGFFFLLASCVEKWDFRCYNGDVSVQCQFQYWREDEHFHPFNHCNQYGHSKDNAKIEGEKLEADSKCAVWSLFNHFWLHFAFHVHVYNNIIGLYALKRKIFFEAN